MSLLSRLNPIAYLDRLEWLSRLKDEAGCYKHLYRLTKSTAFNGESTFKQLHNDAVDQFNANKYWWMRKLWRIE